MKYGSIVEVGVKFLSVKNVGSVKESKWNKFEMIFLLEIQGVLWCDKGWILKCEMSCFW